MQHPGEEIGAAAAKLSPPLTVGGATLAGMPLSDIVLILTGLYAVLQIGFLLYDRLWKPTRKRRKERNDGSK